MVGAGYTGLAAARHIADAGQSVLVLERDRPAGAASGRNGGMAHAGVKHDAATLLDEPGGRRQWDESVTAFEALEKMVADEEVPCAWQRCGHVELAGHQRHRAALQRAARVQQELGEDTRYADGEELAGEIGSTSFTGGLVVARSAALNPYALAVHLLQRARQVGAEVRNGIEVQRVDRGLPGTTAVRTTAGDVRAGAVVLATGAETAAAPSLSPWLARRILAVGSYIVATEPIAADVARSVSPKGRVFFDTRNFLNYWRLSPAGDRIVFGGRTSFAPTTVDRAAQHLQQAMVRFHPQLAGVRVDRAWGGLVDLSLERAPHVGRDPNTGAWFAAGYSGTGVALSLHLGAVLARAVAEGTADSAFAVDPPRLPAATRLPGAVALAGLWYRGRDALGR